MLQLVFAPMLNGQPGQALEPIFYPYDLQSIDEQILDVENFRDLHD